MRRLATLLALFLALPVAAEVTPIGTPGSNQVNNGTSWTTLDVTLTIPAGADSCAASITRGAVNSAITSVVWDADGVAEAFSVVDQTTNSEAAGDHTTWTYILLNPTADTDTVTITNGGSNIRTITASVYCFAGNVTTSVENATNVIGEDVDDTNEPTIVIASGGTSGNLLYAAGAFRGNNRDPISLSEGWTELQQIEASTTADATLQIAVKAAPSDITMSSQTSDENAGHMIEIVAAESGEEPGPCVACIRRRRD